MFAYLIGIFVGCFIIAVAPYLRKVLSNSPDVAEGWNQRYTALFILSYIIAVLATAFVYLTNPLTTPIPTVNAFMQGLVLGFGSNAIVVEISKHLLPPTDT